MALVGEATLAPAAHRYPWLQGPVGAASPAVSQYSPARHGMQLVRLSPPAVGRYVPMGQLLGAEEPVTQYLPAGQMLPVCPSVGVGDQAPEAQ